MRYIDYELDSQCFVQTTSYAAWESTTAICIHAFSGKIPLRRRGRSVLILSKHLREALAVVVIGLDATALGAISWAVISDTTALAVKSDTT